MLSRTQAYRKTSLRPTFLHQLRWAVQDWRAAHPRILGDVIAGLALALAAVVLMFLVGVSR